MKKSMYIVLLLALFSAGCNSEIESLEPTPIVKVNSQESLENKEFEGNLTEQKDSMPMYGEHKYSPLFQQQENPYIPIINYKPIWLDSLLVKP